MVNPLVVAKHEQNELFLLPALANRHGLITGATGTGKTVTLQVLAERFSSIGVPVFMSDVKGDLSGLAAPGAAAQRCPAGRWRQAQRPPRPVAWGPVVGVGRRVSAGLASAQPAWVVVAPAAAVRALAAAVPGAGA